MPKREPDLFRSAPMLSSGELECIVARDLGTSSDRLKGTGPIAIIARDRRALIRALDAVREEHRYLRKRIDLLERELHKTSGVAREFWPMRGTKS